MKNRILLLLLIVCLIPIPAGATEPFEFVTAVVKSFQSAEIAGDRIKSSETTELVTLMKDIIVFNNEIRTAAQFIKPYLSSKNEVIAKSAGYFCTIYSKIVQNNENLLNTYENALNNVEESSSREGTLLRKLSENMATNEELWRTIPRATAMSSYCLVDQTRTENGKLRFLTISSDEKKALMNRLVNVFGEGIKDGPKGGQLPLEGSAALLYSFLGKAWKPSDSK